MITRCRGSLMYAASPQGGMTGHSTFSLAPIAHAVLIVGRSRTCSAAAQTIGSPIRQPKCCERDDG